jgi:hypothetical protein
MICSHCHAIASPTELLDCNCATCRTQPSLEEIEMGMPPLGWTGRQEWTYPEIEAAKDARARGERIASIARRHRRTYWSVRGALMRWT